MTLRRKPPRAARAARGERNNNPLNIKWLPPNRAWNGQLPDPDGPFGVYETPELGIRAAVLQIIRHIDRGQTTLRALISVWAPASENDVAAYVASVAQRINATADTELDPEDGGLLLDLTKAMAVHENGYLPFDDATWERGVALAGFSAGRRPSLASSRTVGSAAIGGGASIASLTAGLLQDHQDIVVQGAQAIFSGPNVIMVVCSCITLVCAGYVAWARYMDWKAGLR